MSSSTLTENPVDTDRSPETEVDAEETEVQSGQDETEQSGPLDRARSKVSRVMLGSGSEKDKADAMAKAHLERTARREKQKAEQQKARRDKQAEKATLPKRLDRIPLRAVSLVLHGLVIAADYLIVTFAAMAVIPSIGAYLHQASGMDQVSVTPVGTIAVWAAPFAFIVGMIFVAAFVTMRGMWRWAGRRIENLRAARLRRAGKPAEAAADGVEAVAEEPADTSEAETPDAPTKTTGASAAGRKKSHHHNRGNRKRSKH